VRLIKITASKMPYVPSLTSTEKCGEMSGMLSSFQTGNLVLYLYHHTSNSNNSFGTKLGMHVQYFHYIGFHFCVFDEGYVKFRGIVACAWYVSCLSKKNLMSSASGSSVVCGRYDEVKRTKSALMSVTSAREVQTLKFRCGRTS